MDDYTKTKHKTKTLTVSVHDVTPKYREQLYDITCALDDLGIEKRNILVVPNWFGVYNLCKFPFFVDWLHELKEGGDEIILHGYTHYSEPQNSSFSNFSSSFVPPVSSNKPTSPRPPASSNFSLNPLSTPNNSRFQGYSLSDLFDLPDTSKLTPLSLPSYCKSLVSNLLVGQLFAHGWDEFLDVSYAVAEHKIEQGLEVLAAADLLDIKGFVAPALLANTPTQNALSNMGFEYCMSFSLRNAFLLAGKASLYNLKNGSYLHSREIGFDPHNPLLDYGSRLFAQLYKNTHSLLKEPHVGVAIHPQDLRSPKMLDTALDLIAELKKTRRLCTYKELL